MMLRIAVPIAAVSGLLLLIGVIGAWYVYRLQEQASEILAVNVASIRAAEELEIVVRETRYELNQFLLTGHREHLDNVASLREPTQDWLTAAERLATTTEEQRLIQLIQSGYRQFLDDFDAVVAQGASAQSAVAVQRLARDVLPNEILAHARRYLDLNEHDLTSSSEQNQTLAERLVLGLLLLGTCGAVAGLVAGYGMARGIGRSILQLHVPIRDVAGKLNEVVGPISVSADPGFEDLELVLQTVATRVATVVEQLQESQRTALRAEQLAAVGQLAAGIAHELRNPLMSMKILVQSAADRDAPPELDQRDLEILEEEIARMERLLKMFLDFARPPQIERRRVDLRQVVEETLNLVAPQAERRGICLNSTHTDPPTTTEADLGQLRQVLLNLLLNALDAVPNGGTIDVTTNWESGVAEKMSSVPDEVVAGSADRSKSGEPDDSSAWVAIQVSDTGIGLPPDLEERIFEPFVSAKETGVGLGLSICKRIVEGHGGTITAENRLEGGTVVTVRLPVIGSGHSSNGESCGNTPSR